MKILQFLKVSNIFNDNQLLQNFKIKKNLYFFWELLHCSIFLSDNKLFYLFNIKYSFLPILLKILSYGIINPNNSFFNFKTQRIDVAREGGGGESAAPLTKNL